MGGVGLSRLWGSHPRLAFVLHLIVTLMIGAFAVTYVHSGAGWGGVLAVVIAFVLMAGSLVFLTWSAIKDHWTPDTYPYSGEPQALPGPRAAWGSAQTRERVLWVLFAFAFLVGMVLGMQKSVLGLVLIVLSIPLAFVAVRAGR